MKVMRWTAGAALLLLSMSAAALPLRETARQISAAAREKGVMRIAILPFEARGSTGSHDGEVLAEKLMTQIVNLRKVRVVERSRLAEVMSERRLAETGATGTAARPAAAPGLQAADALVTGAFSRRGEKMRVAARLVHAVTGEVLAATEEDFTWEGAQDAGLGDDGSWTLVVPAPEFMAEVPRLDGSDIQLRDAPREEDCSTAAERVDRIEGAILGVKARYWAGQLRKGVSPYSLTRNPGSTITDPDLKKRFYDTMKEHYYRPEVPELSPRELERFQREDARALEIYRECGL